MRGGSRETVGMKLFIDQLDHVIALLKPHCAEKQTLHELQTLLLNEKEWPKAHYLATRVRAKMLKAVEAGDHRAEVQYHFEEVCAQALHNMTSTKKPFDPDTPYWIIPLALKLARELKVDERGILEIVVS